jgi:hypothetical protein
VSREPVTHARPVLVIATRGVAGLAAGLHWLSVATRR